MEYKDLLLASSLALLCLALGLFLNNTPNPSFDDKLYLIYGHQVLNGGFDSFASPYSYGYLFIYTIAASLYANWASLASMLEYIGLIILIYLISLRISNSRKIAYATSLISLSSAFIAAVSLRVLPDMLAGLIVALGVYLLLDNSRRASFFAGLVMGLLIFIKLGSASILFPIIIALFLYKKPILPFFIAVALMFIIYMASMNWNFGIFSKYEANQLSLNGTTPITNFITLFVYLAPFMQLLPHGASWQIYPLGLLADLAFLGIWICFLKKDDKYAMWSFILLFAFAYILFGSESTSSYQPITVVARYFILLAPLFAIFCARALKGIHDFIAIRYSANQAKLVLMTIIIIALMVQLPMLYWFYQYPSPVYSGAP